MRTQTPFALPSEDVKVSEKYVGELKHPHIQPPPARHAAFRRQPAESGAREVVCQPRREFFIFDEPTRGIDVGAKEEIYRIMVELLEQGKSIIMISSDMPELVAMSDRIIVMRNGRASANWRRTTSTRKQC